MRTWRVRGVAVAVVTAALALGEGSALASPGWSLTGSIHTAVSGHTATLLDDGRVLVAGGFSNAGEVGTAELYDPASGTWTLTGSLGTPRHYATATLLQNGKVLVAGGYGTSGPLASSELYDPATGTWTATGSMAVARSEASAVRLLDGRVLITGGGGIGTSTATSELYDPATGTWSATGSMSTPRENFAVARLPGGKVLVAGGYYSDPTLHGVSGSELYDPDTGTWSPTGSLAASRTEGISALLDDGTVLVAGGLVGGGTIGASSERYDPGTGTWSPTGSLATARYLQSGTLLEDGRVLVAGGIGVASAETYDPATGAWTGAGTMSTTRGQHTATRLQDGRVLVVAGGGPGGRLATSELYTPATTRAAADADFGAHDIGTTTERDLTVTDSGQQHLLVDGVAITGRDAADFAVVADGCSGSAVAPGASCVVRVRFRPSAEGARSARLALDDNTEGPAVGPALSGTTPTPAVPASTTPAATSGGKVRGACTSRRHFAVTVALGPRSRVRSGVATLNGRRMARLAPGQRKVTVDLRGKPVGRYTLRIRIRTAAGRSVTITRRYRTCAVRMTG